MEGYLVLIIILYILVTFCGYVLEYLNLTHLKRFGSHMPPEFEDQIDQALLDRTRDYTIDNIRFGFVSSIFNNLIIILFFFGGILNIYNSWIVSLNLPFILSGLVFFMLLFYVETILMLPFGLYSTFKIEKRYGFCTMTLRLWLSDLLKSLSISSILMVIILSAGFFIILKVKRNSRGSGPQNSIVKGKKLFTASSSFFEVLCSKTWTVYFNDSTMMNNPVYDR